MELVLVLTMEMLAGPSCGMVRATSMMTTWPREKVWTLSLLSANWAPRQRPTLPGVRG